MVYYKGIKRSWYVFFLDENFYLGESRYKI